MSKTSLTDRPPGVKPEPPPLLATLNTLAEYYAERSRLMREGLLKVCRKLEGRE